MNQHTFRVLEYDKVIRIIGSFALSETGRDEVGALQPAAGRDTILGLLRETREFLTILQSGEKAPLSGIADLRPVLNKLGVAGLVLTPDELLATARTLAAGRRIRKFLQRYEGKEPGSGSAPLLWARAAAIRPLKELEDAVASVIDEQAQVRDSASPELRRIRKQLVRMREDILSRMSRMLQDSGLQKVIQDPVITLRDERYVLPLKPNFRQSLQGVVHGQSGSRATLFVEPLSILEQNNRLAELRMEEQEELERILRRLTSLLAAEADAIRATAAALAQLDAVHAKASFGMEYQAVVPELSDDGSLRLLKASHPLLLNKHQGRADVVSNDIVLERGEHSLILSGPNAGGKTALLKTTGLLCLMAQAGLPLTAAEGTRVPCFTTVFADIGDDQSLEQDLSTFSSHVSRIAEILREADSDSLVLLDELGSGTEPGEGAGLGAAVLETLIHRKCRTIITTHHNALKSFGSETPGAVNAAMEFDPQTLKPTYRLIPGRPGRSYGLDMAARIGLQADVIERARARISSDELKLDRLLTQVEENSRRASVEREQAEHERRAAEQDRKEAGEVLRAVREEAREVRAKARAEAKEVLAALRQQLRELRRSAVLDRAAIEKASADVQALGNRLEPQAEAEPAGPRAAGAAIRTGDTVRIDRFNRTGVVVALHGGIVELEVGAKKIKLPAGEVVPVNAPGRGTAAAFPGWSSVLLEDEGSVSRLNIIGFRVEEGVAEVDRFIDRAGLHHLSTVTIIHGIGTGALRTAVVDFLRDHPLIASFRPGEPAEGGAGVTVAELKK